jgi:hypothetical protein
MMRLFVKMLAALLVAIGLQVLVSAAGGWEEISFDAQCLVLDWKNDPMLRERLLEQAERLLQAQRHAAEMKLDAAAAERGARRESHPPPTSRP